VVNVFIAPYGALDTMLYPQVATSFVLTESTAPVVPAASDTKGDPTTTDGAVVSVTVGATVVVGTTTGVVSVVDGT
jgi:hypothetical protein